MSSPVSLPASNVMPVADPRILDPEKGPQERLFAPYTTYTHLPPAYEGLNVVAQERGVSRRRRCFRVILHTVLLVSLVTFFFPGFVHKLVRGFRGNGTMNDSYRTYEGMDDCVRFANWTIPEVGEHFSPLQDNTSPYPYSAKTFLELPVSSDLLYFLSRGALSSGIVQLAADGDSDSNVASVRVQLLYNRPEFLEHAHVCLLQREEGKNGVGIFTPEHWHRHPHQHHHRPFFAVKISLPAPSGRNPLKINGFETNMPLFAHTFEELEDLVDFKSLRLRSSNSIIIVKSVYSEAADVETTNGPIYGNYTTSEYLSLRSSNGPITTNVTLINAATGHPTEVDMRTSNGHITTNLTLVSTANDHTGGKFKVNTRTSNSPLAVAFSEAPVDSVLRFEGHTSNSPAKAVAHRTFEGDFFLQTSSWFPVNLDHDDTVEDPAGKGRKRDFALKRVNRGTSEGTVKWLPTENRELGSIVLTTSNSPISLKL